MADNIPIEIQTEILKRVPVKSLLQFRSVSKSWKSLIDSSRFIADYNEYQSRPQRLFICYKDHNFRYEFDPKYVIIVDDDNFPQNKFPTTVPTPMVKSYEEDIERRRLVGSSQGLLCFFGDYRHDDWFWNIALIWNPAIRKSIAIDLPVFHNQFFTALGFGVFPNTNEPMLVVIAGFDGDEIYIFRLSSRVWRRLDGNLPGKTINCKERQVAIDGFIYFESWDRLILSFDMTNEEFTEINLPKSFESATNWSISKLRESLAVLEYYGDDENPVCDVWMMEHGVPKTFTKLFTITTTNAWFVLGFRRNGEPILEVNKTDDYREPDVLKVYEPHTGHIKDLGIYAQQMSFLVMPFMETLLLLDQVDDQHIELNYRSLYRLDVRDRFEMVSPVNAMFGWMDWEVANEVAYNIDWV